MRTGGIRGRFGVSDFSDSESSFVFGLGEGVGGGAGMKTLSAICGPNVPIMI